MTLATKFFIVSKFPLPTLPDESSTNSRSKPVSQPNINFINNYTTYMMCIYEPDLQEDLSKLSIFPLCVQSQTVSSHPQNLGNCQQFPEYIFLHSHKSRIIIMIYPVKTIILIRFNCFRCINYTINVANIVFFTFSLFIR